VEHSLRLSELKEGEKAIIVKILGHRDFKRRLRDLGFCREAKVELIRFAPLFDPVEVRIGAVLVSIGLSEAKKIIVERQGENAAITVAICGNPNSGKSTIFNQLTGLKQKVGNWPGVTVEKKEGSCQFDGRTIQFVDLPGTYGLTPFSLEEQITRHYLQEDLNRGIVANVIDSSNLERGLLLTTQLVDIGIRVVVVLNMIDEAEKSGQYIDPKILSKLLGAPVVMTVGSQGKGMDKLLSEIIKLATGQGQSYRHIHINYGEEIEREIDKLQEQLIANENLNIHYYCRWLVIKALERDQVIEELVRPYKDVIDKSRQSLENLFGGDDLENIIADHRRGFVRGIIKEAVKIINPSSGTVTDRLDRIVLHRFMGFPLLLFFLWLTFYVTFALGEYPKHALEQLFTLASNLIIQNFGANIFTNFLAQGLVAGVGGIVVFLPNIMLLFFFISLAEDSGYLARAAFLMDRAMHIMGLHGKSFIPLLMGLGCNVPGIMAARMLESQRDRIVVVLINSLMSCSARLPVYVLLAGTFFGRSAGTMLFLIYLLGIVLAVGMGRLFSRLLFKGENLPFVMELPPYRAPLFKSTLLRMWERAFLFLRKIGSVILLASVIIWALNYFPIQAPMEDKYLSKMGSVVAPIFKPLKMDHKDAIALVSAIPAKEIIVSTYGILYQNGQGKSLPELLAESGKKKNEAFALMSFILIYMPCIGTLSAVRRELGSWKWVLLVIFYTNLLAWLVAWFFVHLF
jgi:ferrous iron transport protein B